MPPVRSSFGPLTVWTFRLESAGSDARAATTSRTLDDVARLRRALCYAVPGAVVGQDVGPAIGGTAAWIATPTS